MASEEKGALRYTIFKDARTMSEVKTASAQLVVVTPPYLGHHGKEAKQRERLFLEELLAECARIVADDGVVASINTDFRDRGRVYLRHIAVVEAAQKAGLAPKDEKIWVRGYQHDMFRKKFSFVLIFSKKKKVYEYAGWKWNPDNWVFTKSQVINGFRDAIAPEIPLILVNQYTREDDLVVSVCSGSGTVLIVSLQEGRRALGYEIDPAMQKIIVAREKTIHKYYSPRPAYCPWEEYILAYLYVEESKLQELTGEYCFDENDFLYEFLEGVSEKHAMAVARGRIVQRAKEYPPENGKFLMPLFLKRKVDMATIKEYPRPKYLQEKLALLGMPAASIIH